MSLLLLSFLLNESLLLAGHNLLNGLVGELLLLHVVILDLSEDFIHVFSLGLRVSVLLLVLDMVEVLLLLLDLLNIALILLLL